MLIYKYASLAQTDFLSVVGIFIWQIFLSPSCQIFQFLKLFQSSSECFESRGHSHWTSVNNCPKFHLCGYLYFSTFKFNQCTLFLCSSFFFVSMTKFTILLTQGGKSHFLYGFKYFNYSSMLYCCGLWIKPNNRTPKYLYR